MLKSGNIPVVGSPPHPNCIINIAEFLERPKCYAQLVVEGALLENPQELMKIEKGVMSVFVIEKCRLTISHFTKGTMVISLYSVGVKPERIAKGTGFFMWDIFVPTPEDCVKTTSREVITKDLILRTDYEGRRRTSSNIGDPSYQRASCCIPFAVWRYIRCLLR